MEEKNRKRIKHRFIDLHPSDINHRDDAKTTLDKARKLKSKSIESDITSEKKKTTSYTKMRAGFYKNEDK